MTRYDLEYKGVYCLGVEWGTDPPLYAFVYRGRRYIFEQKRYISQSADTDHIKYAILQFLEEAERINEMSNLGIAGFKQYHPTVALPLLIEPNAKYQPKRSSKIKKKRKGKKRK